jgi:hypothetical protein
LGKEFVTIPSKTTANNQFISALDLSGSGQVDVLATFRSDLGRSGSVMLYGTSGNELGSFTANVSNGPDITGHWLNENNETLYVQQTGTGLVFTDVNGKALSGSILKTRVTFVGYGRRVNGQASGDTLVWSNKKVWQKLTLAGVYATESGEEVHIQQQRDKLGILSPDGTYRVITTQLGTSGISITIDELAGSFTLQDDEIDTITWADNTRWIKLRSIDVNTFQYHNFPFVTLDTLSLTDFSSTLPEGEGVDIRGTSNNTRVAGIESVKVASSTTDTLGFASKAGDTITIPTGWRAELPQFVDGQFTHIISDAAADGTARVEVRNDHFFTNPLNRFDVDRNGSIQPLDALLILNAIRSLGSGPIALPTNNDEISTIYFDVSGDNNLTPLDALSVLNALSRISGGVKPEGESVSPLIGLSTFDQDTVDQRAASDVAINNLESPKVAMSFGTIQDIQLDVITIDDWMQELGTEEEQQSADIDFIAPLLRQNH